MKARDVMVTNVIALSPGLPVRAAANTLVKNRISGAPVVDKNARLIGVLSEGDLIRRTETETDRRRSGWLEMFASSETLAAEFVKAHARIVSEVMTHSVVTAKPDTPLREIANLMERHRIKRVPIVDNDRVVGIVTRANLLQALASSANNGDDDRLRPENDQQLRDQILTRLWSQKWAHPAQINIIVQDATVDLWGFVESEAEHKAVRILAEETPGVRGINDFLSRNRVQSAL